VKRFWISKAAAGFLSLLLLTGLTLLSGCATTEPDNLSVRPWNSPKGWENGLPGGMMEGR
jgi:hypothetical protein